MAGASLLTLIDDIAALLDDVSVMSKVAVKKTAGVLGDDLALNAEQVTGVNANRELPVVWAVAVGSLKNKAILVPAALLISAFIPWAIMPLLMLGGLFLCYEGAHKVLHKFLHPDEKHGAETDQEHAAHLQSLADPKTDLVAMEKDKIRGAVRTDFILSAEIIVISLGEMSDQSFTVQVGALIAVAFIITIGVYGLVALIVKLDDIGLHLQSDKDDDVPSAGKRAMGRAILAIAPRLMRFLAIAGTIAMFLVGGGIIAHTFHSVEELIHHAVEPAEGVSHLLGWFVGTLLTGLLGFIAGTLIVGVLTVGGKLFARRKLSSEVG